MQRWILKTAVQHAISILPWSYRWNECFQRYVTKGLFLRPRDFETKLQACRTHLENYRIHAIDGPEEFSVLELGTGWFPIVPIGLYLCGAKTTWTYDIVRVLREFTFRQTLDRFAEYHLNGQLKQLLPAARPDRVARLLQLQQKTANRNPGVLLAELDIQIRIGDARRTSLPEGSVDLAFSTFALEHIEAPVIAGLFSEFRRVSRPGGVMSHYIGLKDQYADFDPAISPYNFLQYSDRQWRLFNNRMIPLTRLRMADYRRLISESGYELVSESNIKGSLDDLRRVSLAPAFQKHSEEDLLVLFSWLVARPRTIS